MYLFLVPLLIGFTINSASTFTAFYTRHLGIRLGRLTSIILRDVLGIPVWCIGYVMAVRTASPLLFPPSLVTSMFAWLFILCGAALIITGMASLGWRAAAPTVGDTLVEHGLYAHIRHPLYAGMILELCGLFLWLPTTPVLVACILGIAWVFIQVRLEEHDLIERMPAYREYARRVPRFLPRLS